MKEELRVDKEMLKDNISREFKEFCSQVGQYFGNPDDAFLCQDDPHVNLTWNYLSKKYEAKIEKLEAALKDLIKKSEYGARQWADAWNGGEETEQIKSINRAKRLLNKQP